MNILSNPIEYHFNGLHLLYCLGLLLIFQNKAYPNQLEVKYLLLKYWLIDLYGIFNHISTVDLMQLVWSHDYPYASLVTQNITIDALSTGIQTNFNKAGTLWIIFR